jgi:hypothetical protein
MEACPSDVRWRKPPLSLARCGERVSGLAGPDWPSQQARTFGGRGFRASQGGDARVSRPAPAEGRGPSTPGSLIWKLVQHWMWRCAIKLGQLGQLGRAANRGLRRQSERFGGWRCKMLVAQRMEPLACTRLSSRPGCHAANRREACRAGTRFGFLPGNYHFRKVHHWKIRCLLGG